LINATRIAAEHNGKCRIENKRNIVWRIKQNFSGFDFRSSPYTIGDRGNDESAPRHHD